MGLTRNEDIWACYECGDLQGRHDLWFDGDICEKCNTEQETFDANRKIFNSLYESDYVIFDGNDVVRWASNGDIVLYGDRNEALYDNKIGFVIPCTELPRPLLDELINQISSKQ